MNCKKTISLLINYIIGVFAFLGVVLACALANRDGYFPWYKRLLYFTQQSNVWIGVTCLVTAILGTLEIYKKKQILKEWLFVLKYIFTVSITITGLIFCTLLAPFADFNVWAFSSVLTHIVIPVLAISDFFVGESRFILKRSHVLLAIIPPLIYFICTSILCVIGIDFGRGDPYPYFFFNFYSEVGMFGANWEGLPQLGSFYWMVFLFLLIFALAFLYYSLHPLTRKHNRKQ